MNASLSFATKSCRFALIALCLIVAGPAVGQDQQALASFRTQYDVMMSNFERIKSAQGDIAAAARIQQGRDAMQRLTDEQLSTVYSQITLPDLSGLAIATGYLASRVESATQGQQKLSGGRRQAQSLPFPVADDLISECDGLNLDATSRYALLIVKQVASSILAAANYVCLQDILGENGALACVPLSIAADVANGFFETAQFCAGELTANKVDGNYRRLEHIHSDLAAGSATNTTTIVDNTNAARDAILNQLKALGCEIIRLLNTPDGQRASSIAACSALPGFPYKFPGK
jgi:hypothetical protein